MSSVNSRRNSSSSSSSDYANAEKLGRAPGNTKVDGDNTKKTSTDPTKAAPTGAWRLGHEDAGDIVIKNATAIQPESVEGDAVEKLFDYENHMTLGEDGLRANMGTILAMLISDGDRGKLVNHAHQLADGLAIKERPQNFDEQLHMSSADGGVRANLKGIADNENLSRKEKVEIASYAIRLAKSVNENQIQNQNQNQVIQQKMSRAKVLWLIISVILGAGIVGVVAGVVTLEVRQHGSSNSTLPLNGTATSGAGDLSPSQTATLLALLGVALATRAGFMDPD